jgi:3-ketosteroid 9alpha-monooxygenase subunit A
VDDGTAKVWHTLVVRASGDKPAVSKTDAIDAAQFQETALTAFKQDIEVWSFKEPCLNGLFIPSDGAFMKARIWYKQFYNPRAKKQEYLDQCEGIYVPRGIPPYTQVAETA